VAFDDRRSTPAASDRFAVVRNHPFMAAAGAASVGVVLGAYIAVQLLAATDGGAGSQQAALDSKVASAQAETTGSATPGREAKPACDEQTWPYLSADCIRVVTTDRRQQPGDGGREARPTPRPQSQSAPAVVSVNPRPAAPTPSAAPPLAGATATPPPEPARAAAVPIPAPAPKPPRPAETDVAQAPQQASPARAASDEAKARVSHKAKTASDKAEEAPTHRRLAKRAKSKAASGRKSRDRPALDDDGDDGEIADVNSRFDGRGDWDGSRRIVERWTERDYVVPSHDGRGQRRVTVIRRRDGGLFENLFGFRDWSSAR
jgi:hypothetical protein